MKIRTVSIKDVDNCVYTLIGLLIKYNISYLKIINEDNIELHFLDYIYRFYEAKAHVCLDIMEILQSIKKETIIETPLEEYYKIDLKRPKLHNREIARQNKLTKMKLKRGIYPRKRRQF